MRLSQLEHDLHYLKQMLGYAEEVQNTLAKVKVYGIDLYDEMVVSSLAMHIGQVGEQLDKQKLSQEVQDRFSDILPWSEIKKFRDKAYHHYGGLDTFGIISIAQKDIPSLIENLGYIIRQIENEINR